MVFATTMTSGIEIVHIDLTTKINWAAFHYAFYNVISFSKYILQKR